MLHLGLKDSMVRILCVTPDAPFYAQHGLKKNCMPRYMDSTGLADIHQSYYMNQTIRQFNTKFETSQCYHH